MVAFWFEKWWQFSAGQFCPQRTPAMSGNTGSGGVPGTWWAEARDAAEHSTRHRTAATTKNYLAPNANGAQAEKHWSAWQNKRTAELGYYRTSETKVMLTVKSEDRGSDSNQFRHYLKGSLQLGMTGGKFSQWHLSKFRSVIDYKRDVTVNFWKYHHGEQILYYAIKQNLKSLSEKACAKKNIGSPQ